MPIELKLSRPEDLDSLLSDTPLCHPSVGPVLAEAAIAAGQSFVGSALSLNVKGALEIRAFNSPDDVDDDGILASEASEVGTGRLDPQLVRAPGTACVKFRAQAGVKAAVEGKAADSLGFGFAGSADVVLADYHSHPCSTGARTAVLGDLTRLRTSLKLADVLALGVGDAVSQQVVGRLSATVQVSWSDVFMGPIGPLSKLAGRGASVLVKVSAGATLTASVSVDDDVLLVFSKADAARWRVGVRKALTRAGALSLGLGARVEFADPAQVTGILDAAIEGVVGAPLAAVDKLLAKASLDQLSGTERALADALIERLGLEGVTTTMAKLRKRIADVRKQVKGAVEEVAKAKISLAFAYEYRRVRHDTTVAQCLVDESGLRAHHAGLVRGKIGELCATAAAGTPGLTLEHFLYQKSIKAEHSWGFALSLGKWLTIGGTDRKTIVKVDRLSATGTVQRAFVGARAYRHAGEDTDHWTADLSSSMAGFSRGPVPLLSEFETGVALSWSEPTGKLDARTLSAWLDSRRAVGRDRRARRRGLDQATGRPAEEEVRARRASRVSGRGVLDHARPHRERGATGAWATRWPRRCRGWTSPGDRPSACADASMVPLWEAYLADRENRHQVGREFASRATAHLRSQGFGDLAAMERLYEITPSRSNDERCSAG